jgi:hypothetical protein
MTTTDIEVRDNGRAPVSLFPGATADDVIAAAADVADKFSDVIRQKRMVRRIGDNDHVQIEGWQTIGALTGVVADDGTVTELPWPALGDLWEQPDRPGPEPRGPKDTPAHREWEVADEAWREWDHLRRMHAARAFGRSFGFKAQFRATKNGAPVGWGEGRCTRGEASKVRQDDYALSSMAQTRAQSRALGAPLKFVVKLAGYETTPAEELDGQEPAAGGQGPGREEVADLQAEVAGLRGRVAELQEQLRTGGGQWGPVTDKDEDMQAAAGLVSAIAGDTPVDAARFVVLMGEHFDGLPVAGVTMLRGLARFVTEARTHPPQTTSQPGQPTAEQVYPRREPGRYHGD